MREFSIDVLLDSNASGAEAERAFQIFQTSQRIIADSLELVTARIQENAADFIRNWWMPQLKLKVGALSWDLNAVASAFASGDASAFAPNVSLPGRAGQLQDMLESAADIHEVLKKIKDGEDVDTMLMEKALEF